MMSIEDRFVSVGVASSTGFCAYSLDRFIKLYAYTEWLYSSIRSSPEKFLRLE